jgi:hypothetical protein
VLRIGLGLYHDAAVVEALCGRVGRALSQRDERRVRCILCRR